MQTAQTILHVLSSPEVVRQVKDWLRENPPAGRSALARVLCSTLKLQDRGGKPREAGVLVALRTLEARGFWKLPPGAADPRPPATPAAEHGGPAAPGGPCPGRAGPGSAAGGSPEGRGGTVSHLERVDVDRAPLARRPPGGPAIALSDWLGARLVGSGGFRFLRFASARARRLDGLGPGHPPALSGTGDQHDAFPHSSVKCAVRIWPAGC